ncbi:hypothetical protein [Mesorhizobium sp. LSJC280B00]|nr:hypothetical protein [Mesorhizobium sp. LSJC280B00]
MPAIYAAIAQDESRNNLIFDDVLKALTMPISWKGTLAQYVGRLHHQDNGKTEVIVFDYVDEMVPVLARMAAKRDIGRSAIGLSDPPPAAHRLKSSSVPVRRRSV